MPPAMMHDAPVGQMVGGERRDVLRTTVDVPAGLELLGDERHVEGRTKDVSAGGVLLLLSGERQQPGRPGVLVVSPPDTLPVAGMVEVLSSVDAADGFETRLRFAHVTAPNRQR